MKTTKPVIDVRHVEFFARLGSPVAEIAAFFGVSESTIRRQFRETVSKASAARRIRLREFQWKSATDGNTTMLIFLGKQELGQGEEKSQAIDKVIIRRAVNRCNTKEMISIIEADKHPE